MECGICYAYRLGVGGALPEIVCENTHCGQPFHHPCLLEVRIPLFSPCLYVVTLVYMLTFHGRCLSCSCSG